MALLNLIAYAVTVLLLLSAILGVILSIASFVAVVRDEHGPHTFPIWHWAFTAPFGVADLMAYYRAFEMDGLIMMRWLGLIYLPFIALGLFYAAARDKEFEGAEFVFFALGGGMLAGFFWRVIDRLDDTNAGGALLILVFAGAILLTTVVSIGIDEQRSSTSHQQAAPTPEIIPPEKPAFPLPPTIHPAHPAADFDVPPQKQPHERRL